MLLTAYGIGRILLSMVEIVATDEFEKWFLSLDEKDAGAVDRVVGLLEQMGVALRFPYTSALTGARHALRELRIQSGGSPIRVFYAFDPERQAVLLIGGDKTGDDRFYEVMVPKADEIFDTYLSEQAAKKKEKKP
jgi:hypothetical protein